MTIFTKAPIAALAALICLAPSGAQAQDDRFRVSFGTAAATGTGDASLALSGSFGYRFSERFSFEVDVTGIDGAADRFQDRPFDTDQAFQGVARLGDLVMGGGRFGGNDRFRPGLGNPGNIGIGLPGLGSLRASTDGQTMIGTMGFRYEMPVQGGRLRPYVGGGIGLSRTSEDFSLTYNNAGIISDSVDHTGMAASAGLGASLRVFKDLSVDMDARYFRLSRERNVVRFGGGVSYRF
jgi:opacity protein-like surface antigen